MTESIGMLRFARLGPILLSAAFVFLSDASEAIAGEAQQAPSAAEKRDVSSWVKLCTKNEEGGGKTVCLVKYEELDPKTGSVLLTAALRTIEGEGGQELLISVPTVYGLVIPAGVQAKVDEEAPVVMNFGICQATGCQAQTALSGDMLQKMMSAKMLIVAAVNLQQKTMAFPVPLMGFAKTWKGPPADLAKYQAARYHMLEFTKETAQRERGTQSRVQPQAGTAAQGAVPNASNTLPNATTVVPKATPAPAQ